MKYSQFYVFTFLMLQTVYINYVIFYQQGIRIIERSDYKGSENQGSTVVYTAGNQHYLMDPFTP